MDENLLKTSWRQRVIIILIAVLLLGSTLATYIAIVVSSSNSSEALIEKYQDQYTDKQTEINEYAVTLSDKYVSEFASYKSRVKAYNAESANSTGVKKEDLKEGDGRELAADDTDYFAYYIGWCADETIFDSSFADYDSASSLNVPLYAGQGLIEGWNEGVVGMKLGGIREITMPGELAYGDSREICGGTNSPLKFIVLALQDEKLAQLNSELNEIYTNLINAYYSSSSVSE